MHTHGGTHTHIYSDALICYKNAVSAKLKAELKYEVKDGMSHLRCSDNQGNTVWSDVAPFWSLAHLHTPPPSHPLIPLPSHPSPHSLTLSPSPFPSHPHLTSHPSPKLIHPSDPTPNLSLFTLPLPPHPTPLLSSLHSSSYPLPPHPPPSPSPPSPTQ